MAKELVATEASLHKVEIMCLQASQSMLLTLRPAYANFRQPADSAAAIVSSNAFQNKLESATLTSTSPASICLSIFPLKICPATYPVKCCIAFSKDGINLLHFIKRFLPFM